jgi:hypothetical protein
MAAEQGRLSPTVPESQREGLVSLAALTGSEESALIEALEHAAPAANAAELARQVQEAIPIMDAPLRGILTVLLSLAATHDYYKIPVERLAEDVARTAVRDELIEESRRDLLQARLSRFLLVESIGVSSKALTVMTQHKNLFVAARILTDIRPVFLEHGSLQPVAATIVHNLEITSHTDDEHITFFFAMDSQDLRVLQQVVERALEKEKSVQALLRRAEVPLVHANS